jgi:FkbM family methyltransferase
MASLVGPNGLVYAIEPSPRNVEKLRENIALNEFALRVYVHDCAAWRRVDDSLSLFEAKDSGEDYIAKETQGRTRGFPLNELVGVTIPRLIKIDAEGSEHSILLGCYDWIHQVPFVVCELNSLALERAGASISNVRELIGNDIFQISPGRFPALIPRNVTIKTSAQNCNVLITTLNLLSAAWPEIVL